MINLEVCKSTGIALLLAAGLLAALFAFGVFSPQATPGVGAHPCQHPGDDHRDNSATPESCRNDDGSANTDHASGSHVRPTFSGDDYNSEDNYYEFSIRENRNGSTTAITVGQVMASLPGGGDVTLTFTLTDPSDFTSFPSGHVQYTGAGLNFEATTGLTEDGDRKYVGGTATFQVTAIRSGDSGEGIADRTATATMRVYVEDQDYGPPAAPMGTPVGERTAVAGVDATATTAAVFPKDALTVAEARKAIDVTWERPEGVVAVSTYDVRYRKVGETDDDWQTDTVDVDNTVNTSTTDTVNIAPSSPSEKHH